MICLVRFAAYNVEVSFSVSLIRFQIIDGDNL